ncbi:MAG: hypothetical protein AVDCRST_MAG30-2221 [uncultured Solirubrobacteraceae bacterium]|uniref:Choice-of-anchor B family protein n=1 Tax=uncultured Solirubrobacteraceae bacterium TaxID=1162706 RepID=A0A6J4SVJ0_9ACTN|nr:MAG: hypothetical protein AVDCRST_MAG30-2221 [uncultured Solirubrobacteraceae bacterium]
MPGSSGFALLRSLVLVLAASALTAASAAAHSGVPEQHEAQKLPASSLGPFDPTLRAAGPSTAKCQNGMAGAFPCKNVDLASFIPLPALGGATGNDIWGWTDPQTGREYAIVGTSTSTGFVDVTNAENPVLVGILPTRGTPDQVLWRDIKVHKDHAFIVSEISDSGLQVFDLTKLRGRTSSGILSADATNDEFSSAHNISINNTSETAYVVGSDICANGPRRTLTNPNADGQNGGLLMYDISDPRKPRKLGCALVDDSDGKPSTPPESSRNYSHDVECVSNYDGPDADYRGREICFGSNEEAVVIYDVTDKAAPKVLSQTTYPTAAYTHQGALTEDKRYFLFGDELDEQEKNINTTTYILDVADLDSPPVPKPFTQPTKSIDHNMYTAGNRAFQSNYTAGLRIFDFDNASLADGKLTEVGFFDVVPGVDIDEFAGTWSNYRFPKSGNVAVSAIEEQISGLFVLKPQLPAPPTNGGGGGSEPSTEPQTPAQPQPQPQPQAQPSQGSAPVACQSARGVAGARARGTGRDGGVRFDLRSTSGRPVTVDVFRQSKGRRITGEKLVRRFEGKTSGFTWNGRDRAGRKVSNGFYFARLRTKLPNGRLDTVRLTLGRTDGRFGPRRAFFKRDSCTTLAKFKLSRPVFGGRKTRALGIAYRLNQAARVEVTVTNRFGRTVRRFSARDLAAGRTQRLTLPARGLKRGDYRVKLSVTREGRSKTTTLTSTRL